MRLENYPSIVLIDKGGWLGWLGWFGIGIGIGLIGVCGGGLGMGIMRGLIFCDGEKGDFWFGCWFR